MPGSTLTLSFLSLLSLLLISSSPIPTSSTLCNKEDKQTLIAIDNHFGNPPYLASWRTPGVDCCDSWYGIECNTTTGRVRNLIFLKGNLSGTIPSAIGDLPELESLYISELPNLVGSIPSSITKLNNLVFLSFSQNSLSGPIPLFLSQITSVTFLDLSHNMFSGSIPPSLANLQNLGALLLDHNRLTGPIPDSFGSFPKIAPANIFLSHNRLSGPIPKSLGGPGWAIIDLSHNRLTGDASFLLGSSKPAIEIYLSSNQLSFDLTHVSFPVNLTKLDMRRNMIYGSISAQINEVTGYGLTLFNVSYNQLCGEIPRGNVTAMFNQYSYFHNKCLCGAPLPACN